MMITPTLDSERALAGRGFDVVCGFDEVGRGALAGPVMVGCAIVRSRDLLDGTLTVPDGVADSKLLTEHRREAIYDELTGWCAAWAVGSSSNAEIDEWGISHALGIAALRALAQAERRLRRNDGGRADDALPDDDVSIAVESEGTAESGGTTQDTESDGTAESEGGTPRALRVGAILDGPNDYITKALGTFDAPDVPFPAQVTTKVKGDRHCAVVATAAVIAKVTRDRLMEGLAASQPAYARYAWEHNKGYGTQAHRDAIAQYGPSDLHRLSWKLT